MRIGMVLKPVLYLQTLTLNSAAAPNYKYLFCPHKNYHQILILMMSFDDSMWLTALSLSNQSLSVLQHVSLTVLRLILKAFMINKTRMLKVTYWHLIKFCNLIWHQTLVVCIGYDLNYHIRALWSPTMFPKDQSNNFNGNINKDKVTKEDCVTSFWPKKRPLLLQFVNR